MKFTIPTAQMPFGLNLTSTYSLMVPGLPQKYPGGHVALTLSLSKVPDLTMTPAGIATNWPFDFAFSVTPAGSSSPVPAFDFVAACNISVSLAMAAGKAGLSLTGQLNYLSAVLTPGQSSVGPESGLSLLQDLVQFALSDVIVPQINNALAAGVPLPAIPGVTFTTADLQLQSGFVLVGLDFTLTPP